MDAYSCLPETGFDGLNRNTPHPAWNDAGERGA